MTLSPWRTLQNVIRTQKCEPCQLNKTATRFPAECFPPDTASSTRPKAQAWPQFNHHAHMTLRHMAWHPYDVTPIHSTKPWNILSYINYVAIITVLHNRSRCRFPSFQGSEVWTSNTTNLVRSLLDIDFLKAPTTIWYDIAYCYVVLDFIKRAI